MIEPTKEAGDLMEACIDHALQLVATVRGGDGSPDDVRALLANVPDGRWDAVIIALAAMVDPDARPTELLAWVAHTPPPAPDAPLPPIDAPPARPFAAKIGERLPREHGTPRGYWQHRDRQEDTCADCRAAYSVSRRPQACQDEYARLVAAGVPITEAAERTTLRALLRARARRDLRAVPA